MKPRGIFRFITIWSVLGTIAVLTLLMAIWGLLLRSLSPVQAAQQEPTPVFQVILAPTPTPLVKATMPPTITPTGELSTPQANAQIKVGDYVQITGTGGDGLRIHSGAGTSTPALFLGMESEVFQVTEGPTDADGLVWWHLKAPYDANRSGWAAANYLSVVAQQQP